VNAAELLGADGALAQALPGFAPRPTQLAMAEAVEAVIAERATLLVEAGTGTGKTFAYLLPALLSGRKALIATGTRALQDQLFHRDLPTLQRALGLSVDTALLKGRANYLCPHRLERLLAGDFGVDLTLHPALAAVRGFAERSPDGDLDTLEDLSPQSALRPFVTSTGDNCLGQDCPQIGECFLLKARRAAQQADLVVVNHHLFFADLALKETGFGEVLPDADLFIFDEAHLLPDVATLFFGVSLGSLQLLDLSRDLTAQAATLGDVPDLPPLAEALRAAAGELLASVGEPWPARLPARFAAALVAVRDALSGLGPALEALEGRSTDLDNAAARVALLQGGLAPFLADDQADQVRWIDVRARSCTLHASPVDVAPLFAERFARAGRACVFTSGTLAVAGRFEHFVQRLGLADARTLALPGGFDYRDRALLYLPDGLPEPADPGYTDALVAAALPVLRASRGRAFMLFTSHSALRRAAARLRSVEGFTLLVQGERPNGELLAQFRRATAPVLLGTGSFWQGVDVRGEALSCVIVDKLPFASPGEPIVAGRIAHLRARGQAPFNDYQLPHAVITLKQGLGRLIRDAGDRGVLMVGDRRLLGRGYGKVFLQSLPEMPVTRELADVQRFFQESPA
jgi:ATP-dependent DNA helicase DinG